MFKKVNNVNYVLDQDTADILLSETNDYLNNIHSSNVIDLDIRTGTVKELISYRVAILVFSNIKDDLIKSGFLTVGFSSEIKFEISVGYLEDKLVYGVLIK